LQQNFGKNLIKSAAIKHIDVFAPQEGVKIKTMLRALSVLLLLGGILSADDISDRKAIDAVIGSLFSPQVRSDPQRMAGLTTPDIDGDLDFIPVRTIWCETSCEGFSLRSIKFVTADVAVVDGETTVGTASLSGTVSLSKWLMILKRDAAGWRISSIRCFGPPSFMRGNRLPGN
jgi:hypothetical protein